MKRSFSLLLIVAVLFGGSYWYSIAKAVCDVPIAYRIGAIDSRFNISEDEVKNAVFVAESMWEDATGKNLFMYDEGAKLSINFVFDERQENANEEESLRETLDTKEGMSETVRFQYEELLNRYSDLKYTYGERTGAYDKRLEAYNNEVASWNEKGGAPADVYARLSDTNKELAKEQTTLNGIAKSINALVRQMNTLSTKGNSLITDYNKIVETYNSKVKEESEFTQGDYYNNVINIYQFDTYDQLVIVLAHEFGHALSLEHVTGDTSVLYHHMLLQTKEIGITQQDVDEFSRVCGDGSITSRLISVVRERVISRLLGA